jgi:hypothetical protein
MRWFDQGTLEQQVMDGVAPLSIVVLLAICLFFGSWCGFFLMVSALGNMISMHKGLEKGLSVKSLVIKQVVGGFLLLLFAYLSEGMIGYKGAIGDLLKHPGSTTWWELILFRGYHMETIHAVAWCVILNGLVQGLLSMNGGWKKINRNIKIYIILAVVVIIATQFVWWAFDNWISNITGIPDLDWSNGNNPISGTHWYRGHLTKLPWWWNLAAIFLQPWAGNVEPIFPFLAVSFIGSIIGLYLMEVKDKKDLKDTSTLKKGMLVGFLMAFIGLLLVVIPIVLDDPFDIFTLLGEGFNVTGLERDFGWTWLPYFIMCTGSQLGAICLVFRLVEFRARSKKTANNTKFFRRFGFVAFSVYNFQFIDVLVVYPIGFLFGKTMNSMSFDALQIWIVIAAILLLWHGVLLLWEKVHFALGLEWMIAKIAGILFPSKKREGEEKLPWWKSKRLDPKTMFYEPEWIDIITDENIDHENLKDSKLAWKVSLTGWIFFPSFWVALTLAKASIEKEGENEFNKKAKIMGIIGSCVFAFNLTLLSILTTAILG